MNVRQASRLRGRLAARFPGTPVDVTPDGEGARIFIEHADGATSASQPATGRAWSLLAMLGTDLRAVDDAPEGAA